MKKTMKKIKMNRPMYFSVWQQCRPLKVLNKKIKIKCTEINKTEIFFFIKGNKNQNQTQNIIPNTQKTITNTIICWD